MAIWKKCSTSNFQYCIVCFGKTKTNENKTNTKSKSEWRKSYCLLFQEVNCQVLWISGYIAQWARGLQDWIWGFVKKNFCQILNILKFMLQKAMANLLIVLYIIHLVSHPERTESPAVGNLWDWYASSQKWN